MNQDEQQIRTLIESWADAVHAGDLETVVAAHAGWAARAEATAAATSDDAGPAGNSSRVAGLVVPGAVI